METVLLVLLIGVMNLLAFFIGATTTQKANKGEGIRIPNMNPVEAYKKHREQEEASKEQERLNTMLENINNYKGDGIGQKDIL